MVDFQWFSKKLIFRRSAEFKYHKRRYGKQYPIKFILNKPFIDIFSAQNSANKMIPLNLLIDTGAGQTLMLNNNATNKLKPEKTVRTNLGQGMNGTLFGEIGKIAKITVDKAVLNDVVVAFPDSLAFEGKFPPKEVNRDGSIGVEILRRFRFVLNYSNKYVCLKPINYMLKERFIHDRSGLEIRTDFENNKLIIESVAPDSPAFQAGIRAGDELVSLNFKPVLNMKVSDIQNMLSSKENIIIKVTVKRAEQLIMAKFRLKTFI